MASDVFLLLHGHTSSFTRSISHIVRQSFQIVDRVTSWQLSRHKTTEVSVPNLHRHIIFGTFRFGCCLPLSPYTQLFHSRQHLCEHHMRARFGLKQAPLHAEISRRALCPSTHTLCHLVVRETTRVELFISFRGPCLWACQQGLHWIRFLQGLALGVVVACLSTCAPSVPAYIVWLLALGGWLLVSSSLRISMQPA